MQKKVAIIGAGPAGLTAAYLLAKKNIPVIVFEKDPTYVGGIARTVTYKGYCFDIGGHRFFSKSKEVEDFWTEILPNDMLNRPRSSRIFYKQKFYRYPLNLTEVILKLGFMETFLSGLSYLQWKFFPIKNPKSFADWVSNHFGSRLYRIFFKTYTEKVWGMSCETISADWAAQRIKGLSLFSAVKNALFPAKKGSHSIKTLIDSFRYPRKGPGMLWEECAKQIKEAGGEIRMGTEIISCVYDATNQKWRVDSNHPHCPQDEVTHVISTAPLRDFVLHYLQPDVSKNAIQAAQQLSYRDFLIVVLILPDRNQFTDNWIYIHDPEVDVGRIQNFKSWSPEMVPDKKMVCYGMEYFCFEKDGLWQMSDTDLIAKAKKELEKIGLGSASDVIDATVVRQSKAYPVYDQQYKQNVACIAHELRSQYPSLHLIGRNGMHKYNNQDHSMMTAMLTVENILAGENKFDPWRVNQDAEYHEEETSKALKIELRAVPQSLTPKNL